MRFAVGVALLGSAWLAGCTADDYAADADEEVEAVLTEQQQATLGDFEENAVWPAPAAEEAGEPTSEGAAAEPARRVDLAGALELAVLHNRDYMTRKETLYQQGLSFTLTRFQFGPQLAGAVDSLWADLEDGTGSASSGASLALSQILPTGGTLALTSSLVGTWFEQGPDSRSFTSSAGISLTQPLLRGVGYEVSHNALTQAQRDLIYGVRDFELFRQQFSIDLANRYYDLVRQQQQLANGRTTYEAAVYDLEKALVLRQLERNTDDQVFRARRQKVQAEVALIDAEAALRLAVDDFKIQLGLPTVLDLEIAQEDPPYEPVLLDPESAVGAALANRLDLQTVRQRVEDAERNLRVAANGLLPDLDLSVDLTFSDSNEDFDRATPDDWSLSAGLRLDLPLQRTPERNTYVNAKIALRQAERRLELAIAGIERDVRDRLRRLRSAEQQIALQEDQVEQERRAVVVTEVRYAAGQLPNRDLIEARQGLVNAQNALIAQKVAHFIGRLQLLRQMGLLFIDERGRWR